MTEPKILLFDIETAPALVWTFGLFKPIIGIDQIERPPRVLCWSAKWLGEKKVMFQSEYHDTYEGMLQGLWNLLDEADVVAGYNSDGFDIPWMNEQFAEQGWSRPSPYTTVDLYKLSKKNFRLISGKLDYLALTMLGERKVKHEGFSLWRACIDPNDSKEKKAAWGRMKKYAIQDTALLEPLFEIFRPMITSLNYGLYSDSTGYVCPHCGSGSVQSRGVRRTVAGKFQRYHCQDCGGWSSDSKRIATTPLRPLV